MRLVRLHMSAAEKLFSLDRRYSTSSCTATLWLPARYDFVNSGKKKVMTYQSVPVSCVDSMFGVHEKFITEALEILVSVV